MKLPKILSLGARFRNMRSQNWAMFHGLGLFLKVKNMGSCKYRNIIRNTRWIDQKRMPSKARAPRIRSLPKAKRTSQKCKLPAKTGPRCPKSGPPHFHSVCFLPLSGRSQKCGQRRFRDFWKRKWATGPFEDTRRHFGRVGVLSVSVKCHECHMRASSCLELPSS